MIFKFNKNKNKILITDLGMLINVLLELKMNQSIHLLITK